MTRPRLLDLFCGEGGAARGYIRAGWQVLGVDSRSSVGRHYPGTFVQGDALAYLAGHWAWFDAVHASPPCQRFTHGNAAGTQAERHPDLITPTRYVLSALRVLPYVIENVPRAPLCDPLTLCGTQFGLTATDTDGTLLTLRRHRLFEVHGFEAEPPGPCQHQGVEQWAGSYGGARHDKSEARLVRRGGYVPSKAIQEQLLGIPAGVMTAHGLTQAVPPAYTEHLGRLLLAAM